MPWEQNIVLSFKAPCVYFSDSPHSEPGTIDEVDHDNGTEPHTSDDGERAHELQELGSVLGGLCI